MVLTGTKGLGLHYWDHRGLCTATILKMPRKQESVIVKINETEVATFSKIIMVEAVDYEINRMGQIQRMTALKTLIGAWPKYQTASKHSYNGFIHPDG